jgi:BolA protein
MSSGTSSGDTSPGGPVQRSLTEKLKRAFEPSELQVINESYMHSVPEGSESHFKVVVVSSAFSGLNRVARQRAVNKAVAEELAGAVHAFSMDTLTPDEWQAHRGTTVASPQCLGGSKTEV